MLHRHTQYGSLLFIRKCLKELNEMKTELEEHRYFLERSVERRTQHLMKRLTLLENCNATLCGKLVTAQQELSTLNRQSTLSGNHAEPGYMKLHAPV